MPVIRPNPLGWRAQAELRRQRSCIDHSAPVVSPRLQVFMIERQSVYALLVELLVELLVVTSDCRQPLTGGQPQVTARGWYWLALVLVACGEAPAVARYVDVPDDCGFSTYLSEPQEVLAATEVTVAFVAERYDRCSSFDEWSYRVPETGVYSLTAQVLLVDVAPGDTVLLGFFVKLRGQGYVRGDRLVVGTATREVAAQAVVAGIVLPKGTAVEVRLFVDGVGSRRVLAEPSYTYFLGARTQ